MNEILITLILWETLAPYSSNDFVHVPPHQGDRQWKSCVILLYSECEHETCSFWSSCRGQCHAVLTRVSHTCRLATPLPCLEGTSIGIWAEAGERFTGSSGVFSALRAFDCPLKHRDPRDHTEPEMQQGVAMATAHFRPSLASSFTHLHLEMNYFTRWVDTWLKIHLWTQTYLL